MKTITVKDETHARLRNAGISGESMDVIVNRLLLNCDEKVKKVQHQLDEMIEIYFDDIGHRDTPEEQAETEQEIRRVLKIHAGG